MSVQELNTRLLHYHSTPVEFDRNITYDLSKSRVGKPVGLWVSVEGEDDWPSWCRGEEFHLSGLDAVHEVTLTDDARIAHISGAAELREFHEKWSMPNDMSKLLDDGPYRHGNKYYEPDWPAVAQEYDGIIIAPYIWCMRTDGPFWYYGVDCASGCIWNLDAIESFKLVEYEGVAVNG